jgi:hypothetical protein
MPAYGPEEINRAIGHGWHGEADAPKPPPVEDDHEPIPEEAERAQLYALAEQREIRIDRRWGLERLRRVVTGG